MASFSVPGLVRTLRQSPVPATVSRCPAVNFPEPTDAVTDGVGGPTVGEGAGVEKAGAVALGVVWVELVGEGAGLADWSRVRRSAAQMIAKAVPMARATAKGTYQ